MVRVNVSDGHNTWPLWIGSDSGMTIDTLKSMFPNATNLINPSQGHVPLDVRDGKIYNPDGWDVKIVYLVHLGSRPSTPVAAGSRSATPCEQEYLYNIDWVNAFLFYVEENCFKSCVVALTPHYLVTFRHGTHLHYVKDSTVVRVVSVVSGAQYDATVIHICEEKDYIILKSKDKVVERECPVQTCDVMKRFVVCGFAKGFPELTFIHGTVYSVHPFVYENDAKLFGPFVYGTAKTSPGDSGAACFGSWGLMAVNLGTTTMPLMLHNEAVCGAAIFSPNNYMVTAFHLLEEVAKLEPKRAPKRPHHKISVEGGGEFES